MVSHPCPAGTPGPGTKHRLVERPTGDHFFNGALCLTDGALWVILREFCTHQEFSDRFRRSRRTSTRPPHRSACCDSTEDDPGQTRPTPVMMAAGGARDGALLLLKRIFHRKAWRHPPGKYTQRHTAFEGEMMCFTRSYARGGKGKRPVSALLTRKEIFAKKVQAFVCKAFFIRLQKLEMLSSRKRNLEKSMSDTSRHQKRFLDISHEFLISGPQCSVEKMIFG